MSKWVIRPNTGGSITYMSSGGSITYMPPLGTTDEKVEEERHMIFGLGRNREMDHGCHG